MNHIPEIAKMLGVEIGEVFEARCDRDPFQYTKARFTDRYFEIVETNVEHPAPWNVYCLHGLLEGNLYVKHIPWKPRTSDIYYFVDEEGTVCEDVWSDYSEDILLYKCGNCYKTYAEAAQYSNKWYEFFQSDKMLEV